MFYSVTTASGAKQDDGESAMSLLFGTTVRVASQDPHYSKLSVREFVAKLAMPFALGQYRILYNDFGQCVGFLTWAYLAPDVEKRLIGETDHSIANIEWNEGGSLWVIDFLAAYGTIKGVLEKLRDEIFRDEDTITYWRVKNGRRIVKRLERSSNCSFFSSREMDEN